METRVAAGLLSAVLAACGAGQEATTPGAPTVAGEAASSPAGGARAQVVIAFYDDAACTREVGRRRYDTGRACFAWTAAGSNAEENSATRFQCYSDRLCYTQHPNSLTCSGAVPTDKQARKGLCLKEPAGRLYAMLLSGSDACPPPPPGFECPLSPPGAGTR